MRKPWLSGKLVASPKRGVYHQWQQLKVSLPMPSYAPRVACVVSTIRVQLNLGSYTLRLVNALGVMIYLGSWPQKLHEKYGGWFIIDSGIFTNYTESVRIPLAL